ncbi:cell division protein FtsQ [Thermus filiformis]|uniref:Cell division protein FtsQ n=1 Tax=Thermus filiformis TaxID=276 RepID=A0A0A2WMB0_THEFI|nr:cell division protein FtsQ [Thermus filiformis]
MGVRLVLFALLLATLYVGSLVLLPVEKIQVVGTHRLSPEEVVRTLGLAEGEAWLWVFPSRAQALLANPWVKEARLEKPRPKEVLIRVVERTPIARLANGDGLSKDGVLLPGGGEGPLVEGKGPLPVRAVIALVEAFPQARRVLYTPAGFWVEGEGWRIFAPEAALLIKWAKVNAPKGTVWIYEWGVSYSP